MRPQESWAPHSWELSGAVGQLPAQAGMTFTRSKSKQKRKRVNFCLCQSVEPVGKQTPDPVFSVLPEECKPFETKPKLFRKGKKGETKKAAQTVTLRQTPAILKFNKREALGEALRPAAGPALQWHCIIFATQRGCDCPKTALPSPGAGAGRFPNHRGPASACAQC